MTNQNLYDRIVEQSSESPTAKQQNTIWRSRLVGRGRTIGNRVTGKTVREFESLLLRQTKTAILIQKDCGFLCYNDDIIPKQYAEFA